MSSPKDEATLRNVNNFNRRINKNRHIHAHWQRVGLRA
jgi:hypothetical protein